MLQNARLVFRGVADLAFARGYVTPAGLWRINERDEQVLDAYEGVASNLYRKVTIKLGKEGRREALIYLMTDRTGIHPPSQWYVDVIRDGYRDFNLDEKILDEAIRHSFERKNPSQQTIDRRRRQINSTHQRRLVRFPSDSEDAASDALPVVDYEATYGT
jgi:hypothetical protein